MASVLLTGFEPFAGAPVNPSWIAARDAADGWTGEATVAAALLPVEFGASADALRHAIAEHRPDVVIAIGVAEGRTAVTPERAAINDADARVPDNAGARPIDVPCVEGAPDGLMSSLPVKAIVQTLRAADIPSTLSHTAGTYVCNHVFFHLQHTLLESGARGGFIHVPATASMGGAGPTMEQATITTAVRIAVQTALSHTTDTAVSEGALH